MPRPSCRPFSISDAMILIAGLAVGLTISLYTPMTLGDDNPYYRFITIDAVPVLLSLSTTLFALRLRKPKPSFWRLARQPGMAASMSILSMFLISLPFDFASSMTGIENVLYSMVHNDLMFGQAIIFSWLTLYLTRAWKSERGWIDASGRVLGGIWIGVCAIELLRWLIIRYTT